MLALAGGGGGGGRIAVTCRSHRLFTGEVTVNYGTTDPRYTGAIDAIRGELGTIRFNEALGSVMIIR